MYTHGDVCVCVCVNTQSLAEEQEVMTQLEVLREKVSSLERMIHMSKPPNMKALEKMIEVKDTFRGVADGINTHRHSHTIEC